MSSAPTEESHHKMSKKIAQLTKVIFHLHSKNEENEAYRQAINSAYEREIETILKDANGMIAKQKEALVKATENANVGEQIKKIEETHEREKKETARQFEEYKQKVKDKEGQLEKDYQTKYNELKLEVMEAKKGFENRCTEFKRQLTDNQQNNEAIEELKKAHAKEIASYVQEHNRKYNELLKEKLNMEDSLRS